MTVLQALFVSAIVAVRCLHIGVLGARAEFPRVYSALVPEKETNQDDPHALHFDAEVDRLEGSIVRVTIEGKTYHKTSFLVHSGSELQHLEDLTNTQTGLARDIAWEEDKTQAILNELASVEGEEESRQLQEEQSFDTIAGRKCYKNLQGSFDWMQAMVDRASTIPNLLVERIDIGDSYLKSVNPNEGHDIFVLKVTGEKAQAQNKGIMLMISGLHAREYTPPELVSRWIEEQVDGYGKNASITVLLDHTEIYAILQANPDGRELAETDRPLYQRKNQRPSPGCSPGDQGVDLNRNFPFQWGLNSGSSGNICSPIYRGTEPASEPEVQAIVDFSKSIFPEDQRKDVYDEPYPDTVKGVFLDIHSWSEVLVWPWSYLNLATPNEFQYLAIANKITNLNLYRNAGPSDFFFEVSGGSTDFAYSTLGTASFAFELGTAFYQGCNYFQSSILRQNMKALSYTASISSAPFHKGQGPDIISASVTPTGAFTGNIAIEATASDSAQSRGGNYATAQQPIQKIEMYIDQHPDETVNGEPPIGIDLFGDFGSSTTVGGTYQLDISSLSVGQHTLYLRAIDGDGFKGPVTALWVTRETVHPSEAPSESPLVVSDQGQPDWFQQFQQDFTNISFPLRRCFKRMNAAPKSGSRCGPKSKTCFFGDQICSVGGTSNGGGSPYPTESCICNGTASSNTRGTWVCQPEACPTQECSDATRSAFPWTDKLGHSCQLYGQFGYCSPYGDDFANHNLTANQACCVCGGGVVDPVASACSDIPVAFDNPVPWTDADSDDCSWYAERPLTRCVNFGNEVGRDGFSLSASEACCACQRVTPPSEPSPCQDLLGWTTADNRTCREISKIDCVLNTEAYGITALDACCKCGVRADNPDALTSFNPPTESFTAGSCASNGTRFNMCVKISPKMAPRDLPLISLAASTWSSLILEDSPDFVYNSHEEVISTGFVNPLLPTPLPRNISGLSDFYESVCEFDPGFPSDTIDDINVCIDLFYHPNPHVIGGSGIVFGDNFARFSFQYLNPNALVVRRSNSSMILRNYLLHEFGESVECCLSSKHACFLTLQV